MAPGAVQNEFQASDLINILTWSDCRENYIRNLDDVLRARCTHADHNLWIVLVLKSGSFSRDD